MRRPLRACTGAASLWRWSIDNPSHDRTIPPRSSKGLLGCCVFPALAGAVALAGWAAYDGDLQSLPPILIQMNPLTAVCFSALALALWLRAPATPGPAARRRIACFLAIVVAIVGAAKLASYFIGFDFPLDRWMFAQSIHGNRMAPNTALCFILTGVAIAGIDRVSSRGFWPAQLAMFFVGTVSLFSLIGWTYGATSLYRVASYTPMALNTALSFGVLSIGVLIARPHRGVVAVIRDSHAGGALARRLIPVMIGVPWGLGWLRVVGQHLGFYDTEFGSSMVVAINIMLFVAAVAWIARALNRTDAERRHVMDELNRSSAEIFDLYNRAPCGYHSLDANGVVIAINDTELAWLGYERREIVGRMSFADFVVATDRNFFRDNFDRLKRTGSVNDLQYRLKCNDGHTIPVILNATAVYDAAGSYLSSRSMLFDATEQKRAEAAIQLLNEGLEQRVAERTAELAAANRDLEQKNRENETFVYSASHDLRSPLVNLQGFSKELSLVAQDVRKMVAAGDWTAEKTARGLKLIDVDVHQAVEFIQAAVGRLDRIIDALLRLARAGRVEYRPQLIDANLIVASVVQSMAGTLFDRDAEINVAPLPICWCDPAAFEQVFANLLGNAVNYLDPARPGKIEVGVLPAPRGADEDIAEDPADGAPSATTFFVKDNGLGIDSAYHGKVFHALKRLHPQAATGEGMGLAIVKRIVDRHDGQIWFESAPDIGTIFYVQLPLPPEHPVAAPPARASTPERSSHEVLRTD